jgi:trimethylamine--corrinoid protein Co-methyltransferase
LVSNWQNFESWEESGSVTADQRATRVWQDALERYEQPVLAPEIEERLAAFVARRRVELRDVDH